jgi:hypothetical protein
MAARHFALPLQLLLCIFILPHVIVVSSFPTGLVLNISCDYDTLSTPGVTSNGTILSVPDRMGNPSSALRLTNNASLTFPNPSLPSGSAPRTLSAWIRPLKKVVSAASVVGWGDFDPATSPLDSCAISSDTEYLLGWSRTAPVWAEDGSMFFSNFGEKTINKRAPNTATYTTVATLPHAPFGHDYFRGNLYVASYFTHKILKLDLSTLAVTTFAGTGTEGFSGDGGDPTSADLEKPGTVGIDQRTGDVYFASRMRIRRVNATTGKIDTFLGGSTFGGSGNTVDTSSTIGEPTRIVIGMDGSVFVSLLSSFSHNPPGGHALVIRPGATTFERHYPPPELKTQYILGIVPDGAGGFLVSMQVTDVAIARIDHLGVWSRFAGIPDGNTASGMAPISSVRAYN